MTNLLVESGGVDSVGLADAKARLSEIVDRAEGGEAVTITRRGKPVAVISGVDRPRKPIDVDALRALTATMMPSKTSAVDIVRELRDSRY